MAWLRTWVGGALVAAALWAAGCDRAPTSYDMSSPERALDAAHEMVVAGEADRLSELIFAEDEQMRSLLNQAGRLLGALQDLGDAAQARFPEAIEAYKAEAKLAAEEGRASSWATWIGRGAATGGSRTFGVDRIQRDDLKLDTGAGPSRSSAANPLAGVQMDESQRRIFNTLAKQIFADPYGWLAEGRDRLGTVYVTDERSMLTWDGTVLFPPFGLVLVRDGDAYRLEIPWNLPVLRTIRPRDENEYFVFGSMLKTMENVVRDLEAGVNRGEVRNLTDLADEAVEKAAIPMVMVFLAYGNLIQEREREARRAAAGDSSAEGEDRAPSPTAPGADDTGASETSDDGP